MIKKQLFIRGDLNSFQDGFIPLRNPVWVHILKQEYGDDLVNKSIWLYEKTLRDGKEDLTIFPGVIEKLENDSDGYKIIVNEDDFVYLSDSEKFSDYKTEDVIGNAWDEAVEKYFPQYKS